MINQFWYLGTVLDILEQIGNIDYNHLRFRLQLTKSNAMFIIKMWLTNSCIDFLWILIVLLNEKRPLRSIVIQQQLLTIAANVSHRGNQLCQKQIQHNNKWYSDSAMKLFPAIAAAGRGHHLLNLGSTSVLSSGYAAYKGSAMRNLLLQKGSTYEYFAIHQKLCVRATVTGDSFPILDMLFPHSNSRLVQQLNW